MYPTRRLQRSNQNERALCTTLPLLLPENMPECSKTSIRYDGFPPGDSRLEDTEILRRSFLNRFSSNYHSTVTQRLYTFSERKEEYPQSQRMTSAEMNDFRNKLSAAIPKKGATFAILEIRPAASKADLIISVCHRQRENASWNRKTWGKVESFCHYSKKQETSNDCSTDPKRDQ